MGAAAAGDFDYFAGPAGDQRDVQRASLIKNHIELLDGGFKTIALHRHFVGADRQVFKTISACGSCFRRAHRSRVDFGDFNIRA